MSMIQFVLGLPSFFYFVSTRKYLWRPLRSALTHKATGLVKPGEGLAQVLNEDEERS